MAESTMSYERSIEAAGIALASGDHTTAERSLRAAIHSIEGRADSHLELSAALIKLGTLKLEMSALGEAEEFFRRALEIGEKALGRDNLGLVPALKGLGTTRLLQARAAAAEPLLASALTISERHLGEDHPDIVILLNDLTRLYLKQAAHAYAEPLLLRLLELKRSKGEDHPEVGTVLASLAAVRQALGRHEAAEQLWRRVVVIRERTLAPNHFAIATALEHLGETCSARGRLSEAMQHFQRALTIREATLGRDHASLRGARERIADLELQASENFEDFDVSAMLSAPPSTARPSPAPAPRPPAASLSSLPPRPAAPLPPAPLPPAPPSPVAPLPDTALAIERAVAASPPPEPHVERPAARGPLDLAHAKPAPVEPAAYLSALQDISDELELEQTAEQESAQWKRGALATALGSFLQKRRAAAVIGISAVTLPIAAWAVAGAVGTNSTQWAQNAVAEAPARPEPISAAVLPELTKTIATDTAKPRETKASSTKSTESVVQQSSIALPTAPQLMVRVDSVRSATQLASSDEALLRRLAVGPETRRAGSTALAAPTRARMIGSLPTPRYPAQQLHGGAGGEVRVRFDVDTTGRPVISTFAVVGSPLPQLANAVREVIPSIRFEPARTPWPESRALVETVELSFHFAPPPKK
jgi:TonB family protein